MESLFYVYFRKWCSGANQITFHDCQKNLQNHVFSRIVHLASTRAPVIASLMLREGSVGSWELSGRPW